MQRTPEQEQICLAYAKSHPTVPPDASIEVSAGPGCGKTTTAVMALEGAPEARERTLNCAFNKRIQLTLEEKMPPGTNNRTFNSLGHAALMRQHGRRMAVDQDKIYKITKDLLDQKAIACEGNGAMGDLMSLARLAKATGLVPKSAPGLFKSYLEDEEDQWWELCDSHDIEPFDGMFDSARKVLNKSIALTYEGIIDFSDQIYMSVCFGAPYPKFDLVVVDEAQDMSALNHAQVRKMKAGRVIGIGDPHQSIYGFRGAHADSMDVMKEEHRMEQLPLMTSFRCPKSVIAEAQRIVPELRAFETNPEGEVWRPMKWTIDDPSDGAAILCRNNKPLFKLAFKFIRAGRRVTVLGRDIGQNLKKVIEKIGVADMPIREFSARLHHWRDREIALKPSREGIINDKFESIIAIAEGSECGDVAGLLAAIDQLFASTRAPITLSSVHKAKGMEWPEVWLLDQFLIPSKYARAAWALEQEENIRYVAITRAMRKLVYADSRDLQ